VAVDVDGNCLVIDNEELIEAILAVKFGYAIMTFLLIAYWVLVDPFSR